LIGGIGGAFLGVVGALIGVLGGTGRAKRLAIGLLLGLTVLGVVALAVGVVALVGGQPYAVYYPLLLGGGIAAGVSLGVLPCTRKRYEGLELRRMAAKDIAG